MELSLFDKYKNIQVVRDGTLPFFEPSIIESMKLKVCSYCGHKLYPTLDESKYFCKSKRCGYYIQNRKKYWVSGIKIKQAEEWKK